ncbi:MAG: class I SAM-dependent methyltransferase [Sedimenticola sp.]
MLPPGGDALDLACGRGVNAMLLAQAGLNVTAWDSSVVAIARLDEAANEAGLKISAEVRDVVDAPPEAGSFDVILVSHFLDRSLVQAISAALRRGGLLFYQTFSEERVSDAGPSNPGFRLADNELLTMFNSLHVRVYREEGRLGELSRGWRDRAMLVAEKR